MEVVCDRIFALQAAKNPSALGEWHAATQETYDAGEHT